MSEGKSTPGPFSREHSPISDDEVILRHTGVAGKDTAMPAPVFRPVALPYETMDEGERDELVDLLNKGTHYDGMLKALKALLAKHIEVCEQEFCTGPHNKGWSEDEEPIRSAVAAIAAAGSTTDA